MKSHIRVGACAGVLAVSLITMVAGAATTVADRDTYIRQNRDPDAPCFRWPAVDMDGDGVFDRVDNCVTTPPGCTVDQWGCPSDADGDGVCDGVDRCPNTPGGARVDDQGCHEGRASGPPPSGDVERQLVESGSIRLENVYFEKNSANLLPESEATLNEVGRALEKYPDLRIEIQGHTDTRGTAQHNQNLSRTRSAAVRQYLVDHFKLRKENVTSRGYGESQPETRERNDEERFRNRRVMIKVLNPEALPKGVKIER